MVVKWGTAIIEYCGGALRARPVYNQRKKKTGEAQLCSALLSDVRSPQI
jgi:hypothetical protein